MQTQTTLQRRLHASFAALAAVTLLGLPAFCEEPPVRGDQPNTVSFSAQDARFVRFVVSKTSSGNQACIDELEVYAPGSKKNLALASSKAKATASSALAAYQQHRISHLNDGLYGNGKSWIPQTSGEEWAQIELPETTKVDRIVFSRDRECRHGDRVPVTFEIQLSLNGKDWTTVKKVATKAAAVKVRSPRGSGGFYVPGPAQAPVAGTDGTIRFPGTPGSEEELKALPKDALGFANLARSTGAQAAASSVFPNNPSHQIIHLNDGLAGNAHSWISKQDPSWAEIDLGDTYWIYHVAFGSDSSGQYKDRAATKFRILTATKRADDSNAAEWTKVYTHTSGKPVQERTAFTFAPVQARFVRIDLEKSGPMQLRIDEIEIFGQKDALTPARLAKLKEKAEADAGAEKAPAKKEAPSETLGEDQLRYAFLGEEHAWLKTYGRADLSPRLVPYNGRVKEYPRHVGDDRLPLPALKQAPALDGALEDTCWLDASRGAARVSYPYDFDCGALITHDLRVGCVGEDLFVGLSVDRLLSSHIAVISTGGGKGGLVLLTEQGFVFQTYTDRKPDEPVLLKGAHNKTLTQFEFRLPLALLPDCRDAGIRVGLGMGGKHTPDMGRGIELAFADWGVGQIGPCLNGEFAVRLSAKKGEGTVEISGNTAELEPGLKLEAGKSVQLKVPAEPGPIGPQYRLTVRDTTGGSYVLNLFRYDPLARTLELAQGLADRLEKKGLDVAKERKLLARFTKRDQKLMASAPDKAAERAAFYEARLAKRRLFMREPDLAPMDSLLFVKRRPFEPSHNYSVLLDSRYRPGGGIYTVQIPRKDGRFEPSEAKLAALFTTEEGIPRNPMANFDATKIYFAHRPAENGYFHIMSMNPDGSGLKQLTDGTFHDYWPCPLPDGGLAFITTRCKARFLCWRPQAAVMFRMDANGENMQPLSYANLSEWAPSVMNDGRIIWTRSEYQDKGADFGHTLWAVRPDGTKPELVFGNDIIQPNGYANGREVPGTGEICATLISHFGDLNGPIALLDVNKGRFNPEAITSLTPEVPWPGMWPKEECFRDAVPMARDYFLCSHAPLDRFAVYVIDRYGNREVVYADRDISSMCPTLLQPRETPPMLASSLHPENIASNEGEFVLRDVYAGISPPVKKGQVKYIRIVEEVRANLEQLADGKYRNDHPSFLDWYATPVHKVSGPYGWTTYVAKAPHGLVPVEEDGSVHFKAPAGKVLYFQALDKDFNELQRMRSVVQLQPGEKRSCIGCHEHREYAPSNTQRLKARRPVEVRKAAWEGEPFSYEKVVQPVFDAHCVECHDKDHKMGVDLRGTLDREKVPASYRTLVSKGLVHYADMGWNSGGCEKIEPLQLGTLKSRLWEVLNAGHKKVRLSEDETLRVKTWIDLNCPLWPDYVERSRRPDEVGRIAQMKP